MNERETRIWDVLCELSSEEVVRAFTNFYGTRLLSPEFYEFLKDEGYEYVPEEDEEEVR